MVPISAGAKERAPRHIPVVGRRSYGTGTLYARRDGNGRETWYGSWRVRGTRVKRRIGPKRRPGAADGLTRTQAEAELRRRIATDVVVTGAQRRTVAEAGDAYLDHLEHVMERKRTTLQDYRGYLRTHLAPFFGGRPLDKIDRARVEAYLKAKKHDGLSSKTVQNHPQLPPRHLRLLDQAAVGDGEPGGTRRPSQSASLRASPDPLPAARGAPGRHTCGAAGRARRA
jgi:hypothetical protein